MAYLSPTRGSTLGSAADGDEPSGNGAGAGTPARVDAVTKWVIALFFVVLLIPGSFYIGVRMTPYRLYLLAMAAPALLRLRADPTIRLTFVDVLIFLALLWRVIALVANHGLGEIVFAGASFAELFLGYVLGRAYIRSAADFRWFFNCFLAGLVFLLPFALLENATHTRVLRNLWGLVLTQGEAPQIAQIRFGLMRAITAFDHPTIFGGFCAIGFANVYYLYLKRFPLNFLLAAFIAFVAMLAISSSSIIVLALQTALIAYDRLLRGSNTYKWVLLVGLAGGIWFSFQLVTGLTVPEYIISKVMFSQDSGNSRMLHFVYGSQQVMRTPLFGVGLDDWGSPYWLSQNVDSFWLGVAVRYGAPALALMMIALAAHFLMVFRSTQLDAEELRIRSGYMISFAATVMMFGSVSFFAATLMFFMMFCGAGVWLYDKPRGRAPGWRRPRHLAEVAEARAQAREQGQGRRPDRPRGPGRGQPASAFAASGPAGGARSFAGPSSAGTSRMRGAPSAPQSRG